MEIQIISNVLKSDEIYSLLDEELKNQELVKIEKKEEPYGSKALDPSIVTAIIGTGMVAISLIVNTIITVWATKRKDKEATIKIKYFDKDTQSNIELEFPVGTPKEKIDEYIKQIKNNAVKRIIIFEK